MPIIIVEGVDGSGKSTFVEKLLDTIPWGFDKIKIHRGVPVGTVEQEYVDPLLRLRGKEFLVTDRWHVGEMIYGPIYRGESKVKGVWEDNIELYLGMKGAVRVIMAPPIEVVKQRLADRGEDYLKDEHVDEVYDFYKRYAEFHGYLVVEEGTDELAQELVAKAIEGAK